MASTDTPSDLSATFAATPARQLHRALLALHGEPGMTIPAQRLAPDLYAWEDATLALDAALALRGSRVEGLALHLGLCVDSDQGLRVLDSSAALVRALAGLAGPGRLLLSEACFDALRASLPADDRSLQGASWRARGRYLLENVDEPVGVVELRLDGDQGEQPLPERSGSLRRLPDEGLIGGWRPAPGQQVPTRPDWRLQRRLGAGGFGEAWLAQGPDQQRRVFKFCFHELLLASLQREIALFRLLSGGSGSSAGIVPLLGWQLEQPPHFLEFEYLPAGDLHQWSAREGGVGSLPRELRLEIVAQIAEALSDAHAVGVLHKDLKPGNVLIDESGGCPQARLGDFGIGALTPEGREQVQQFTVVGGGSASRLFGTAASLGGTPMYMAPELFEGRPPSLQADAYALGVLLFQMAVGDLRRALPPDWTQALDSEPLVEDLGVLLAADPRQRSTDLRGLASRLRDLPGREQRLHRQREAERRALQRRRLGRLLLPALAGVSLLALVLAGMLQRISTEAERANAEATRANAEARTASEVTDFFVSLFRVADPAEGAQLTVREALDRGAERVDADLAEQPAVRARLQYVIGSVYRELGLYAESVAQMQRALEVHRREAPGSALIGTLNQLAATQADHGNFDAAAELLDESLALMEQLGWTERSQYGDALSILGSVLNDIGERERAGVVLRRTLDWRREHLGVDAPELAVSLNNLGVHYLNQREFERAGERIGEALDLRRRVLGEDHIETGVSWNNLAAVQRALGQFDAAEQALSAAIAIWQVRLGDDHPHLGFGWTNLASVARVRGRAEDAIELATRAIELRRQRYSHTHPLIAGSLIERGLARGLLQDWDSALDDLREALDIRLAQDPQRRDVALARLALAELLLLSGQPEPALPETAQALALLQQLDAAGEPAAAEDLPLAGFLHGWALAALGRDQESRLSWQASLAQLERLGARIPPGRGLGTQARLQLALGQDAEPTLRLLAERQVQDPVLDLLRTEGLRAAPAAGVAPPR